MAATMDRDPVTLLGRAVGDPLVVDYLRFHDETRPFNVSADGLGELYGAGLGMNGFSLSAAAASVYEHDIGEPLSRVTGEADEMIVRRICFSDVGCATPGSKAYPHALPFGLRFGDPADLVSQKLGAGPRRQSSSANLPDRNPVRFDWIYWLGETNVLTKLTESQKLAALYLWPFDRTDRLARERQASLEGESVHIDPANAAAVEALRAAIPTSRWREAMEDGDELFTEAIITQATGLLDRYIDEVKAATMGRSAPKISAATKQLVFGLNSLNEETGAIETLERDELGEFMDRVIRATGFRLRDGEDITEQWREW